MDPLYSIFGLIAIVVVVTLGVTRDCPSSQASQSITSITGVLVYRRKIVEYEYKSTYSNPYTNWKYSLGDIFHYQVFSVDVDIAPKMSKLVNLRCDPELYVHQYCNSKSGCTGCGNTSSIHYDIEFRLLSYEIEE